MRPLGKYPEVMEARDPACPRGWRARLSPQAWHSFTGGFFDRTQWYPNIGFRDALRPSSRMPARERPGSRGACDRGDIPRQIGAALREAREPRFLYWLTVNSHLPVLRNDRLQTENCAAFDATLDRDYPMVCRLLQLFDQTARAGREICAGFPDTDILIVGDHLPPFRPASSRPVRP